MTRPGAFGAGGRVGAEPPSPPRGPPAAQPRHQTMQASTWLGPAESWPHHVEMLHLPGDLSGSRRVPHIQPPLGCDPGPLVASPVAAEKGLASSIPSIPACAAIGGCSQTPQPPLARPSKPSSLPSPRGWGALIASPLGSPPWSHGGVPASPSHSPGRGSTITHGPFQLGSRLPRCLGWPRRCPACTVLLVLRELSSKEEDKPQ